MDISKGPLWHQASLLLAVFIGGKEVLTLALHAGEERNSLKAWCFESGSSGNMSNSSEKNGNFRPCNKFVLVANDTHLAIEGHGNL